MKAIVVRHPGGPDVLDYTDVPTPTVKPGWTLIKVRGFGINHSEIFTREGASPSVTFPRILGIEAVGTVAATSAPDRFTVGQTVVSIMGEMGRAFDGGYAEMVLLPNDQVYPVHTTLDWADLAAVPETFYTADGIVRSLQIQPHDRILIRAATSGVGVAAAKLIHALAPQAQIVGTTRSAKKVTALKALGFTDVLVTPDPINLPDTHGNFDKIVDLIGGRAIRDSLNRLNEFGIVNSTGELGGEWTIDGFDPITDIPNNRYLTGFASSEVAPDDLQNLLDFITDHHVDVHPAKVFDLAHTADAHRYLESGQSLGKVVVLP
ncbi:zinc-binding dehydrogenase [Levilactobacillus acidifarinae]|uniref:GroES-like protein n=1 Tax=Levilactobacillus acidifarinae DSM 19394 = JCM 15949 TaxID=1423715 RepID=A0A0R1LJN2_9LACO|nr:zinc-binding dehydrogenase [Levilactobacillus acidifarinae]KRK95989.1 GroES-like protein [Levilactobacillus acidifarinae DSM 19394]GEO69293.1 quinone oxidoreductase [Levilactobacillus acidifarinae]